MNVFSDVNQWIGEHQALAITFGLPAFKVFVGFLGSFLSHKSKSDEIRLSARIRLSEYRKDNLDRLQSEIAELQSFFAIMMRERTLEDQKLTYDDLVKMVQVAENILSCMRSSNKFRDEFFDRFSELFAHLNSKNEEDDATPEGQQWMEFRETCHKILNAEWMQLENELKRLQ